MAVTKSELTKQGPFPQHFDPWLEKGHYFHQFHAEMIGFIFGDIEGSLFEQGYFVGREASIQISEAKPDIFVLKDTEKPVVTRNYEAAVLELSLDAGVALEDTARPELDRISIFSGASKRLVTTIELVSPSNKHEDERIMRYQSRRKELLEHGVDVVEIDLSRSFKHLLDDPISREYPYHTVIHLFENLPRFIGMKLGEPLKSFGLPVEDKIIPIELQRLYRQAYEKLRIAYQMLQQGHYIAENLPFPTTINDSERESLLAQLKAWEEQVKAAD